MFKEENILRIEQLYAIVEVGQSSSMSEAAQKLHTSSQNVSKIISKLEKELLEKSDKIVCISTSDYDYFKGIYPNKVEFLPHRIELQKNSWEGKG